MDTVNLRPNPLFFGVINVEQIVDVIPNRDRTKRPDVVLHELLHRIWEVRKPFAPPFVVPFNDLDPGPRFGGVFNPFRDLLVRGSRTHEILEVLSGDFRESEEKVIERTIKVIFASRSGQSRSTLIQCAGSNDIAGQGNVGLRG